MALRYLKNRAKLLGSGKPILAEEGTVYEVNVLRLASNVADAQTVTIGDDVFEFDRAANGVTAGRIPVTGHADDTPANASTKLVLAINSAGTQKVTATKISSNEIRIVSNVKKARALTCTETLAGSNNAWAASAMFGGSVGGLRKRVKITRVPTAVEVALGSIYIPLDFTPALTRTTVRVVVTATPGVALAWDGVVTVSGNMLVIDNSASTDWDTTHTIIVEAWES